MRDIAIKWGTEHYSMKLYHWVIHVDFTVFISTTVIIWRYQWDSVSIQCLFSESYPEDSCLFINRLAACWRYEEAYTAWHKKGALICRHVFQMYGRVEKKKLRNKHLNVLDPEDKISLNYRTKLEIQVLNSCCNGKWEMNVWWDVYSLPKGIENLSTRKVKNKLDYNTC